MSKRSTPAYHLPQQPNQNTQSPNLLRLPIVASLAIHAALLALLALSDISTPNTPAGLNTTLISQADLAAAKKQLAATQNQAGSSQPKLSAADAALLNAKSYQPSPKAQQLKPQQYQPINTTSFDSINEQIWDSGTQPIEPLSENTTSTSEFDNKNTNLDTTSTQAVAPNKEQINAGLQAAKNRIETAWKRHSVQPNQSITFQINLDANGNVTGINYISGHNDLRESVEAAVMAAAPFSELAGLRNNIKLTLITEQLIGTP